MNSILKKIYKKGYNFFQINWIKTIYVNFKVLPLKDAKKLPIIIFGNCKITNLSGKVKFLAPIKFGMLGLGQRYEIFKKEAGSAEINIQGLVIIKSSAQFGYDYKLFVGKNAEFRIGNMASMASGAKVICTRKIILGDFCRMGSECQIIDTNFHDLKNPLTNEIAVRNGEIHLGSYNFISNRVSIMGKTKTGNYVTIASNSLLNKDYTFYGENILIGGIPAKKIKDNITRDWETEKKALESYLTIKL